MSTGKITGNVCTPDAGTPQMTKQNHRAWHCTAYWWDRAWVLSQHWYFHRGMNHINHNYWFKPVPFKALCIVPWYGCRRSQIGKLGITVKLNNFSCLFKISKCDYPELGYKGTIPPEFALLSLSEWINEWVGVCSYHSLLSLFVVLTEFEHKKWKLMATCDGLKQCSKQTVFQVLSNRLFSRVLSRHDSSFSTVWKAVMSCPEEICRRNAGLAPTWRFG